MKLKLNECLLGAFTIFFLACEVQKTEEIPLNDQISAIQTQFAPDKRVALFNVKANKKAGKYILNGESNLPDAINALKERLTSEKIQFVDSIRILPSKLFNGKTHAIVNISVANLRSNPGHSSELATQATLGTPLKVFKKENNWYYVQTPDKYLAWVDAGGIDVIDNQSFAKWKSTKKIIYLRNYGQSYLHPDTNSQTVSDLVAGDILLGIDISDPYFIVQYPDGRRAYVSKDEAEDYDAWLNSLAPNEESLVTSAKALMGVPYLWGGTSTKGVDCSGFTKTIYFLNGMVLPRDASQQVHTGKLIDSTRTFENLKKGDLLFFGRKATDSSAEKVVHVAMWIGNNEFIHSSGRVQINSIDKNANNYDEYNYNRYLRSNRYLNETDSGLIDLTLTPLFKN